MLYFDTEHHGALCVTSRERIVEGSIGMGSIKQDIRDEHGAHAHTEARDNGKSATKRFAERSAGGKGRSRRG